MIRALICDFGGVLTSPLVGGFLAYQDETGVTLEDLGRAMERSGFPLFELERGEISEEEFGSRLAAELPDDFDIRHLRELYFENLEPNRPMIDCVRELHERGLRTALCTNNVREWEPLWRAKLPELDEIFDVVVDSAFVGTRKPEREIFEITLERLDGVSPQECVFVDDLEPNCEAARGLGMTAIRFRDAQQAIAELAHALES